MVLQPFVGPSPLLQFLNLHICRSQWPCDLRHELSSAARTLGSWVWIPLRAWMFGVCMCLFCVCGVLCVGSGLGRAIAQAICRRLSTAAARVRVQVRSCGICGGQSGIGARFLRILQFSRPILIPPPAPHSSCIIRGWCNRPLSGRRTSPHKTPKERKKQTPCDGLIPCPRSPVDCV
jgi:hypothetical protein